jgi:hypothetical protein
MTGVPKPTLNNPTENKDSLAENATALASHSQHYKPIVGGDQPKKSELQV